MEIKKVKILIYLILIIGIFLFFRFFYGSYTRNGTLVKVGDNFIILKGNGIYEPEYVFKIDKKVKIFNEEGKRIKLTDLKEGTKVKIKLSTRGYGSFIFKNSEKKVRTIRIVGRK